MNAQEAANNIQKQFAAAQAGAYVQTEAPRDPGVSEVLRWSADTLDRIEGLLTQIEDGMNGPMPRAVSDDNARIRPSPALRELASTINGRLSMIADRLAAVSLQV